MKEYFWLVPAQNPDFTEVVLALPISGEQKRYLLKNDTIQSYRGVKLDKVYVSSKFQSWNRYNPKIGKKIFTNYSDITYIYQGEASVVDGKVVIDTIELDAEKYNL